MDADDFVLSASSFPRKMELRSADFSVRVEGVAARSRLGLPPKAKIEHSTRRRAIAVSWGDSSPKEEDGSDLF